MGRGWFWNWRCGYFLSSAHHLRPNHPKKWPDSNRAAYLKASRMDDFIAYGALHKHEVELAFLFLHCILLSCLATHEAHGSVGQHRLEARKNS